MADSKRGFGITFIDLDDTLFRTYAKVNVVKDGKIVRALSNSEFNTYILEEGESFEFSEFSDSRLFRETSVPIPRTMKMVREMMGKIKETKSFSRIIVLTARPDFHDKETFLQTFTDNGIDISDKDLFYIDRMGNKNGGSVAEKKRDAILNYLKKGIYRRCRMIDDNIVNLRAFIEMGKNIPEDILESVRKKYNLKSANPIKFYALQIDENGKLRILE